MNKSLSEKIANYFILLLFIILLTLVGYNVYILFTKITMPKEPPRNSIRVSPISGENISVTSPLSITKVIYGDDNLDSLGSIDKASIVYENYDTVKNQVKYSALFDNLSFSLNPSMEIVFYQSEEDIPKINFIKETSLKENSFVKESSIINIFQNGDIGYSIVYYDGYYHKFDKAIEASTLENTTLTFDNIVIKKNDTFFIFTKGFEKEISSLDILTLSKGKSYYINLSPSGYFTTENN